MDGSFFVVLKHAVLKINQNNWLKKQSKHLESHTGIKGNEEAEEAAKKGRQGEETVNLNLHYTNWKKW